MILDDLLSLASAQSSTLSVASTNVIDTLAAGDAYVNSWFVFQVTTAFAAATGTSGATTATIQIQTSATEDFSGATPTTLAASAAFTISQLTAGKYWAVRIGPNVKRYIRGYKVVSDSTANVFGAGAWSMVIVNDINKIIGNTRYAL